jgi:hypothetical protein
MEMVVDPGDEDFPPNPPPVRGIMCPTCGYELTDIYLDDGSEYFECLVVCKTKWTRLGLRDRGVTFPDEPAPLPTPPAPESTPASSTPKESAEGADLAGEEPELE